MAAEWPTWVPADWRAAWDPRLCSLYPDVPDPYLPTYYGAGLAVRKLSHAGGIGFPKARLPRERLLPLLPLAGIRRVRRRTGTLRYVTTCPSCRRDATFLVVCPYLEQRRPYCRVCCPLRPPPLVSLAAAYNAQAQLMPLPFSRHLQDKMSTALLESLSAPSLEVLLPALTSPVLDIYVADRWRRRWNRAAPPAAHLLDLTLPLLSLSLHPVHFLCRGLPLPRSGSRHYPQDGVPGHASQPTRKRDGNGLPL